MYYSYVEIEYVATSFSPVRTDLALKLLSWSASTVSLSSPIIVFTPQINIYRLVWVTRLLLAAIVLVFPALVLGYNFFIVESMTYQFLYSLKNLYDYRW